MKTFKIVGWETVKVIIIITCIVILCANMMFMAKFNDIDRGLDAVYDEQCTNHQEIKDIIQSNQNK